MKRFRQRLLNGLTAALLILCITAAAFAIHACYYCETLTWWGKLAPDGHQDEIYMRPWVGQGQIEFIRWSYALQDEHLYIPIVHGHPPRNGPVSGFEFRHPARWTAETFWAFRKEHRLFGLFSFQFQRVNFDLARDIGHPHIYENGGRVSFPLWPLVILFGLFPMILFFRRRRERKRMIGRFCIVCGYDLRATPDRCPECGTTSPKKELPSI